MGILDEFVKAQKNNDQDAKVAIEQMLLEIWNILFPHVSIDLSSKDTRENVLWKSIGFQNKDPMSDIRGSGAMGVKQFLYMLQQYPEQLNQLIEKHKPRESIHYPIAAAGFAITVSLGKIPQIGECSCNKLAKSQLI